jgi:DNA (cytosine-5)-methyltransferase 1
MSVTLPLPPQLPLDLPADGQVLADPDWLALRARERPKAANLGKAVTAVDMFSGSGGMTVGLEMAAHRAGVALDVRMGVEIDREISQVYARNTGAKVLVGSVDRIFDGNLGNAATWRERHVACAVGELDVLLGGPPCQGHSDLNNHTRRRDPKNRLYLAMARAAEVLEPRVIVIENVPPVQWDSADVVGATKAALQRLGYMVDGRVLDSSRAGVPQRRRRYIMLATRIQGVDPSLLLETLANAPVTGRTVEWAIKDLSNIDDADEFDRPSSISSDNQKRIQYLVDHGLTDLPNSERPDCHRTDPTHSYKSMYGRLSWDKPAQTITTGFSSMGQGRFVHPSKPRTLTPHEAARLQTFPDWFDWGAVKRTHLATMIGNAVPPLLMAAIGRAIVPSLVRDSKR